MKKSYIASDYFSKTINSLKVSSVIYMGRNYDGLDNILADVNMSCYKKEKLSLDKIKSLRDFIAKTFIDSESLSYGLWQNQIGEVLTVLKICDKAIYDDGCKDLYLESDSYLYEE